MSGFLPDLSGGGGGGSFTAGGDLTGTSTSQQVAKLTGSAGIVTVADGTGILFDGLTTLPSAGNIRFPRPASNITNQYITTRNAANTSDANLISMGNAANESYLHFGSPSLQYTFLDSAIISSLIVGNTYQFNCIAGALQSFYQNSFTAYNTTGGFKFSLADDATNSITGQTLTLQAQNATGTTTVGGDLNLLAGTGTSSNGKVVVGQVGTTIACRLDTVGDMTFDHPIAGIYRIQSSNNGLDLSAANDLRLFAASGGAVIKFFQGISENFRIEASGISLVGGAGDYGSGSKVAFISNCTTAPTATPTGGGILYVEAGTLKYKGPSGTVTPIALP